MDLDEFTYLQEVVIELNDVRELRKVFGWKREPIIDDPQFHEFDSIVDINARRIRDAECIGTVMCNTNPSVAIEIGTCTGHATSLMAINAPQAKVYTLNITPEEIVVGEGGELTTVSLEREEIGSYYRERKLTNITQFFGNSARWKPDIGTIDVAFVDGCHDAHFVYNDTRKILRSMRSGSFVLWHDFDPNLVRKFGWIRSVCLGVEKLFADGLLNGHIFHVRDSWVGIHQVS